MDRWTELPHGYYSTRHCEQRGWTRCKKCPTPILLLVSFFLGHSLHCCITYTFAVYIKNKLDSIRGSLQTLSLSITLGINDKFIHSTWSKGRANSIDDCLASIYIANQLRLALRCISAFLQQDDWCLLQHNISKISTSIHLSINHQSTGLFIWQLDKTRVLHWGWLKFFATVRSTQHCHPTPPRPAPRIKTPLPAAQP